MKSYKGRGTLGLEYPLRLEIDHTLRNGMDIRPDVYEWCQDNLRTPWVFLSDYSRSSVTLITDQDVNLVHFKLAWV